MPAPENAVPAGGAIDSHEIAPLAVQAPTALPVCADKAMAGRLTLAVADPVADPTVSVSDSGARLPPVVADPVAAPVGEESEAVEKAALAVADPVADPAGATREIDWRAPLASTPALAAATCSHPQPALTLADAAESSPCTQTPPAETREKAAIRS